MATMKLAEDVEEVKKSVNFMSEKITKVVKQQTSLMELIEEVQQLNAVIKKKIRRLKNSKEEWKIWSNIQE